MKTRGILLPVSALPARHGIGDFGNASFEFVDWLRKGHFDYWQILPLNPLGPGNSPYLTTCSNAIDFRYISLDELVKDGLLKKVPNYRFGTNRVRYEEIAKFKIPYLKAAYKKYSQGPQNGLKKFKTKNPWVVQYATYELFAFLNNGISWNKWPTAQRDYFLNHRAFPKKYVQSADFIVFLQYIAYKQWKRVLSYAHEKGIKIIGDIPFYVGFDSVDCWINRKDFLLDENYNPRFVGGVPPDYFSETGQRWGNPIYDFENMKKDDYSFLVNRIGYTSNLYDIVRLDHFRAFDSYYAIPSESVDAKIGKWELGPGKEFFDILLKQYPNLDIIAEDLGFLSPGAYELRDSFSFPGMNVIQFTLFNPDFVDNGNLVVYSGTHDNETLWSWYKNLKPSEKKKLSEILGTKSNLFRQLKKYILNKPSKITIIPMWDYLELGSQARFNTPGTVGSPNFEWKMRRM